MTHETEEPLVELTDVAIGYGKTALVKGIDLTLMPGDFLGLVGPNGAGKSTLLKTILPIQRPLMGVVRRRPKLKLGYVPQRTRIDPIFPLTALEVVILGGMGGGLKKNGRRSMASATRSEGIEALARVGMDQLRNRSFRYLSGGQQQRCLIARALVRAPDLLVLDEPTAGMDLPAEQELLDLISTLSSDRREGIILVVHQLSLVANRASKIALINKDKSLFRTGPREEFLSGSRLTELYDYPLELVDAKGHIVIRAAKPDDGV